MGGSNPVRNVTDPVQGFDWAIGGSMACEACLRWGVSKWWRTLAGNVGNMASALRGTHVNRDVAKTQKTLKQSIWSLVNKSKTLQWGGHNDT